ncbi:centromere protein C isoform X4 [Phyllostomus discolor]|uniref:Centromere protein C n=1 Tax=Phyllostomus discolor TaxID=89673 RepID=A0A7E6DCS3_9CHIR|nr:centromere protein C isoform X4 [Phyllostomus discolor]
MAASGLDHLKNGYRRRFCRPPRAPDINLRQDQNVLVILQDCFEEKSLANDFSTDSTKSILYSTPKEKDTCLKSTLRVAQSPISHSKSVSVSLRKKGTSQQFTVEPSEAAKESVQAHEVHQKVLATDVGPKNTPDSRKLSDKKLKNHLSEADEEFYLSVGSPLVPLDAKTSVPQNAVSPIRQKRETYIFEDSINMLSSSTEISLKTRKRLDFEDKDISKKVEIENKVIEDEVSERPQEGKPSETSQKITQDSEYEIQPQAKKSFSTLFLETLNRKNESSPVVKYIATAPPQSSPANDMNVEDEFIIDESDNFASRSWITIPRKAVPPKQCTVSRTESTALLQSKKSREKHHSVTPVTLTNDEHSGKGHPVENSQPSEQRKLGRNCILSDEMENNCRSTKNGICSKNAKKSSANKRTIKQKQKRKVKATVFEGQVDMEQAKDKNTNMSHIARGKSRRNSERSMKACEEERNVRISKKQMPPVESKKSHANVSHTANRRKNRECEKKDFSSGSKKNNLIPEEVTSTVTRSNRISRRPSSWWMVKSEQSLVYSNSSVRNELSMYNNGQQKPAEKTNESSKNIGKKPVPFKGQKRANSGHSRAQKILNAKVSRGIIDHDETSGSSQNEFLECDEADVDKKKHLDHPGGPSRRKNYLMSGKNNSAIGDEEVQESSDNSRVKRSKVTQENKIHHKLVLPSNTPNVRRTKRTRLKPLEYWRGERVDYQERESGGFVIGGILSPDTVSSKRKAKGETKKMNKIVNRKRICLDDDERKEKLVLNLNIPLGDPLQPTRVKDPETRKIVLMDILRPRDMYQFSVGHDELKVYKTLDTPIFSTGKLILGPHQEKGRQHVGLDTLVFYVNFGDLLCTLHETPYIITTGDSFYVPSGNYYNIRNLLNEESILLFTQIKR